MNGLSIGGSCLPCPMLNAVLPNMNKASRAGRSSGLSTLLCIDSRQVATSLMQLEICGGECWGATLIARFMGPTWGPPGDDRTQVGPMLAPWALLSGYVPGTYHGLLINWIPGFTLRKKYWWLRVQVLRPVQKSMFSTNQLKNTVKLYKWFMFCCSVHVYFTYVHRGQFNGIGAMIWSP